MKRLLITSVLLCFLALLCSCGGGRNLTSSPTYRSAYRYAYRDTVGLEGSRRLGTRHTIYGRTSRVGNRWQHHSNRQYPQQRSACGRFDLF